MSGKIFFDQSIQQKFEEDGIVTIPVMDSAEIAQLTAIYQKDFDHSADGGFHSTMFINDAAFRRRADEAIRNMVAAKVSQIIMEYRMLFANFIVKGASVDTAVGIHQDWNFTSPEYTSLNIWIPLVDIDAQTGLFYALRGSHRTFQNIRYTPMPDDAYAGIKDFILGKSTAFSPRAGEAVIYNGALVHYSAPNVSGGLRIAIGMALIPKAAPALHYYKRNATAGELEIYETDEAFYNSFDFAGEPKGAKKAGTLIGYKELPSMEDLNGP